MTTTLYIEGSLCARSGAAGWAAIIYKDGKHVASMSGPLVGQFAGAVTMAELAAVRSAVGAVSSAGHLAHSEQVTIAMRSTAPLAVLRWVFSDAPFTSDNEVVVHPPKRLKSHVRDAEFLYELSDIVDAGGLRIALRYSVAPESHAAADIAKQTRQQQRQEARCT